MTVPDPTKQPVLSVEEAGKLIGLGRSSAYQAVKRGEFPVIRIGGRVVVPTARFLHEILGYERPVAHSDENFK